MRENESRRKIMQPSEDKTLELIMRAGGFSAECYKAAIREIMETYGVDEEKAADMYDEVTPHE
jgi:hypothetical protein